MPSQSFDAAYPGWCQGCGEDFDAGDPIRYDDEGMLVHDGCEHR